MRLSKEIAPGFREFLNEFKKELTGGKAKFCVTIGKFALLLVLKLGNFSGSLDLWVESTHGHFTKRRVFLVKEPDLIPVPKSFSLNPKNYM